jgi:hypothetical protein
MILQIAQLDVKVFSIPATSAHPDFDGLIYWSSSKIALHLLPDTRNGSVKHNAKSMFNRNICLELWIPCR